MRRGHGSSHPAKGGVVQQQRHGLPRDKPRLDRLKSQPELGCSHIQSVRIDEPRIDPSHALYEPSDACKMSQVAHRSQASRVTSMEVTSNGRISCLLTEERSRPCGPGMCHGSVLVHGVGRRVVQSQGTGVLPLRVKPLPEGRGSVSKRGMLSALRRGGWMILDYPRQSS